ncbi:MAG TPA: TIR domain-containing protein [Chthoniobacterales bacterium]|nr:TIR domain-containing protein [Chthoniobacterales bacterium]
MAHDVFISHSAQDKAVADAVCAALENAGVRCWIAPRDVQPGRSFAGEITRAIQQSKAMVLIFSAHSNNSQQVLREVQLAVSSHLHIVQFRIEDVRPNDDLTYFLSTPHWLDAMTPPVEKHSQRLVAAIETLLGTAKSPAPPPLVAQPPRTTTQKGPIWMWVVFALLFGLAFPIWRYYNPAKSRAPVGPPAEKSPAPSKEIVIEFPDVPTKPPTYQVAASPYLHEFGIGIRDLQPADSKVVLVNNLGLYGGQGVHPTTSQNLLTQLETGNVPASFTLRFDRPASSVSFVRPRLYPETESGITHPAWSAHALDANGNELSSQSEGLLRCDYRHEVPARTYTLHAPAFAPIVALRFDSDPNLNGRPFAAFSALLIERITLDPVSD